ncbi:hypothetical protein MLD38_011978 [Melastoma candidum]|uniref:Uncharacterized protein n=1 Tax=Melastoma candidum TaxID=119954 RepID=A0ACB9R4U8_9MYRT|nr:hypothetical protein MLD38_011978 [Melastoma candidum]
MLLMKIWLPVKAGSGQNHHRNDSIAPWARFGSQSSEREQPSKPPLLACSWVSVGLANRGTSIPIPIPVPIYGSLS